ncbi:hypothetical protein [Reyranella sp. CPCC 100927]|uniref:hypothetical protein n=1 Tax=Reyranella sp. CPCC 100927 TaxID=2599616 RepID=UPI0011B759D1|nr:hypothetical protein [Reyranella sp. CPCC 100927]TWT06074.1 hypothetical protein FQU96_23785 [Reyranella sp. CPCC 100927]
MRYIDNQFEWPILWRIGSGPRALRSLDDALEAVDQRLEEIEGRLVYSDEITALLGLREAVEAAAVSLGSAQITAAVSALRTFAATYRPMVAIPEGDSLDVLFAPILSPRRGWHSDAADA